MNKGLDALEIIKDKKVDVPYIIENPEEKMLFGIMLDLQVFYVKVGEC